MAQGSMAGGRRKYRQGKKSIPVLDYDHEKGVAFSRRFGSKLRADEAADFQRLANFFETSRYVVLHMMIKYCKQGLLDGPKDSFADFMRHNNYDLVVIPEALESEKDELLAQIAREYGISREDVQKMAVRMAYERERAPAPQSNQKVESGATPPPIP